MSVPAVTTADRLTIPGQPALWVCRVYDRRREGGSSMSSERSLSYWFERVWKTDSAADRALWESYFAELAGSLRRSSAGCRAAGEKDVAARVNEGLFRVAEQGRFPLWRVATTSGGYYFGRQRAMSPTIADRVGYRPLIRYRVWRAQMNARVRSQPPAAWLLAAVILALSPHPALARIWTDHQGRTVDADLLRVEGGTVVLRRSRSNESTAGRSQT